MGAVVTMSRGLASGSLAKNTVAHLQFFKAIPEARRYMAVGSSSSTDFVYASMCPFADDCAQPY